MLPRTDLLIVTTPAIAAQKVAARAADMARRSFLRVCGVIENMSVVHLRPRRRVRAVRHRRRPGAWPTRSGSQLLGQVPLEPAVAAGGDAGEPGGVDGTGLAAAEFRAIADKIIDEVAPPVNMAGCSARMLSLVAAALDAADQSKSA